MNLPTLTAQLRSGWQGVWSRRKPREQRLIGIGVWVLGLAALWILLSILSTAAHDLGDATGLLVVGAVVAFLVLRNRSRRQRPPDAP